MKSIFVTAILAIFAAAPALAEIVATQSIQKEIVAKSATGETGPGLVPRKPEVMGGASYVARGRLTVTENGETRAARGDEITHVRWTMTEPAAPGAAGSVSFRAVVR